MRAKLARVNRLPKLDVNQERQPLQIPSYERIPDRSRQSQDMARSDGTRFSHFMEAFDGYMRKSGRQGREFELQARDRAVVIDLPDVQQGELDDDTLKYWITDVCNNVFSSAFHLLSNETMNYEYTKIFCSEGILRNIMLLTNKYRLNERQIRMIDDHIQQKIVPYMKKKYPMTESTDVNKTIDQSVKPIDNREALENDLLQKSGVVFTYRQSGNYNDLIMRFLNWMMISLDSKEDGKKATVYEEYYEFVSKLFENVYDEGWMNIRGFTSSKDLGEIPRDAQPPATNKEIYKEQVKQYTHYAIGRKISKNVQTYTEEEIQSGHLNIKSPAILRILTKWCEELWEKFNTKNYFLDREENVRVQERGGNINTMFMWMKLPLNDLVEEEKTRVERFMDEIQENIYDQQARLLLKELQKDGFTHVERIEKACGKFAFKTVNNLHSYITLYLNRLMHGLLTVSKTLFETKLSSKARWTSPPDLITFKVGDLMRCKCSSKEREILKIFQEMQSLSDRQPKLMKIVRVKNRLKQGTKDILINVTFNEKYLCEFQLAVNAVRSKFIEYSNMFSHYIYQLGRTPFGPLTELSSVWMSLDPRSEEYLSIIKNEQRVHSFQAIGCKKQGKEHVYSVLDRPFVCSDCNIAYSHSNYIWAHQKCEAEGCTYKVCARCRIESQQQEVLKSKLLQGQTAQLRAACGQIVNRRASSDHALPTFGVCIQIQSKRIHIQRFKKLQVKKIMTIFGIKNNKQGKEEVTRIDQLIKKDAETKFLRKYLVFEISPIEGCRLIDITIDRAKKEYIIPQKVREIYKKEKEILSLIEENLDDASIKMLQGSLDGMQQIKNMQLADNRLTSIKFITENFPNLRRLQLSRNRIDSIDGVSKLKQITKLNLRDNKLIRLPDQIAQLTMLEGLNIRNNFLTELPKDFGNLRLLNKLESDNNQLQTLPESFARLTKMRFIDLSKNKLTAFPECFKGFTQLRDLALAQNNIGPIPEWIGDFKELTTLQLSKTKATNFPKAIYSLKKLYLLKIESSEGALSSEIGQLANLKDLWLQMPNIQTIPEQIFKLGRLEELGLQDCKMKELPDCLSEMRGLTSFSLVNNRLDKLAQQLTEMARLRHLRIEGQNISDLPQGMAVLTDLRTLSLDRNNFEQVPPVVLCYSKLHSLTLRNNKLTSINADLPLKLPELETLAVEGNKLNELPLSLKTLRKLKKVTYNDNAMQQEPTWLKDCLKKD